MDRVSDTEDETEGKHSVLRIPSLPSRLSIMSTTKGTEHKVRLFWGNFVSNMCQCLCSIPRRVHGSINQSLQFR